MSNTAMSAASEAALDSALPVILDVAQQAGALVLDMHAQGLERISSKSNKIDLVTEADVASEQLIRQALQSKFPTVGFWGEESNQPPDSEYFWVVDPIDGTTNFAHNLPFFAVNIALNRGPTTLLGVTLELPAAKLYYAKLGQGAYERTATSEDIQLRVNNVTNLNEAFITTDFPYHRTEYEDNNLAEFTYFLTRTHGLRCMGSAAMDLVNVARGSTAGYWEGWLSPWDGAPGVLLVREAGGQVTDYLGRPWQLTSRSLVASNGQPNLHAALVNGIQQARSTLKSIHLPASELS